MRKTRDILMVSGLLAATVLIAAPARAATITVTTNADEFATGGGCSLREAVQAAENNAAFGGCPAGSVGHDEIVVPAGTYELEALTDTIDEAAGDLDVSSDVTITGAGASRTIVDGIDFDRVMGIQGATVTLIGMTFRDGSTGLQGGGVFAAASTVTLSGMVITSNESTNPMSGGGGVSVENSELTLTRTTVAENEGASGPGIWSTGSQLTVLESTLSGNIGATADGSGGGIFATGGSDLTLRNSTVTGNTVPRDGGGIHNDGGDVTIENATITGNTADDESDDDDAGDGGGIRNNGGTVTVANSIIAGNRDRTASVGEPEECSGAVTSLGYNLIGHDEGCTYTPGPGDQVGTFFPDLEGIDPELGPLSANGGPTETHALLPGSPALDRGNPAAPSSAPSACATIDQRGVPRPQGGRCDIGAYELGECLGVLINHVGTEGSDSLTGTDGDDGLLAKGGADQVSGLDGNDALCLGDGNDKASGGGGDDQLLGEKGNDRLRGQAGRDVLKGQQGKDKLNGGGGKDRLVGGPKKDTCSGGPGRDTAAGCSTERKIP